RNTLRFFPIQAQRTSRFDSTEATTSCTHTPQDHEGCRFMPPAFTNIGTTSLFTNRMETLTTHQLLQLLVILSLGSTNLQPLRTPFGDNSRHSNFLRNYSGQCYGSADAIPKGHTVNCSPYRWR